MSDEHPIIESRDVEEYWVYDCDIDMKTFSHRYNTTPSADKPDYNDDYDDIK